jgi:hypothetical protein
MTSGRISGMAKRQGRLRARVVKKTSKASSFVGSWLRGTVTRRKQLEGTAESCADPIASKPDLQRSVSVAAPVRECLSERRLSDCGCPVGSVAVVDYWLGPGRFGFGGSSASGDIVA